MKVRRRDYKLSKKRFFSLDDVHSIKHTQCIRGHKSRNPCLLTNDHWNSTCREEMPLKWCLDDGLRAQFYIGSDCRAYVCGFRSHARIRFIGMACRFIILIVFLLWSQKLSLRSYMHLCWNDAFDFLSRINDIFLLFSICGVLIWVLCGQFSLWVVFFHNWHDDVIAGDVDGPRVSILLFETTSIYRARSQVSIICHHCQQML